MTRRPIHPDADLATVDALWAEWSQEPETDTTVQEILDRCFYETISNYDPAAGIPRLLQLRVTGPNITTGELESTAVQQLLNAFQAEVRGASQGSIAPQFKLTGVSSGSAVLHLKPETPEVITDDRQLSIRSDRVDDLMATITDLHRAAEGGEDLRRFASQDKLLKGLFEMVKALDSHDLELDVGWRSSVGSHRRSSLTRRGRQHVRRQWEDQEERETVQLTGRLSAIDLKGTLTLRKVDRSNRTYQIAVEGEQHLLRLGLALGSTYTVLAERLVRRNRAGLESQPRYSLVRIVEPESGLL